MAGRPGPADGLALWTDATAPKDVAQLAVHKKKVDEVKAWLQQVACPADAAAQQAGALPRIPGGSSQGDEFALGFKEQAVNQRTQGVSRGRGRGARGRPQSQNGPAEREPAFAGTSSKVLVLRGPPGSGKSVSQLLACIRQLDLFSAASDEGKNPPWPILSEIKLYWLLWLTVVKVLASSLGLTVHEWSTPVPTLWAEHKQLQGTPGQPFSGTAYASKLDSFVSFLQTNTKFAPLQLPLASNQAANHLADLALPSSGFLSRLDPRGHCVQIPALTQSAKLDETTSAAAAGSDPPDVELTDIEFKEAKRGARPSVPVALQQPAGRVTASQATGPSHRSQVTGHKPKTPAEGGPWGSLSFLSQAATESTGPRKRGDVAGELSALRGSKAGSTGRAATGQVRQSAEEERVYVSDSEGSEDLPSQRPSQSQSQQPSQGLTQSQSCSQNQAQSQCSSQGLNLSQEWGKKGTGVAGVKKGAGPTKARAGRGKGSMAAGKVVRGGKGSTIQATLDFHTRPVRSTRNTAKVVINLGDDVEVGEEEEDCLALEDSSENKRGVEGKRNGRTAGSKGRKAKVEGKRKGKGKGRTMEDAEEKGEEESTGIEDDLEDYEDDDDDLLSLSKRGAHRRSKPPPAAAAAAATAGPATASKGNGTLGSFWSRPRKAAPSAAKADPSTLEDSSLTESSLPFLPNASGLPRGGSRRGTGSSAGFLEQMRGTETTEAFTGGRLAARSRNTADSAAMPAEVVGPPLLLLDDFPFAGSRANLARLCSALHTLAASSAVPAVIILSDATTGIGGGGAGNDSASSAWDDTVKKAVVAALQDGGAHIITFNPLTPKMILKTLTAITASQRGLPPGAAAAASATLGAIAEQSGGDLRRAICQVQLLLSGYRGSQARGPNTGDTSKAHAQQGWTWDPGGEDEAEWVAGAKRKGRGQGKGRQRGAGKGGGAKRGRGAAESAGAREGSGASGDGCGPLREGPGEGGALEMAFPRDHSLTLFHAIGKFLYNKRKPQPDMGQGHSTGDASRHPTGSQNSHPESHPQASIENSNGKLRASWTASAPALHAGTAAPGAPAAGRGDASDEAAVCRAADEALDPSLRRAPLDMRPAEDILGQSQIEAPTLCSFLHENYLDFLDQDGGLEDAAAASSYMSDGAALMAGPSTGRNNFTSIPSWAAGEDEACTAGLSAAAAASVAARGLLFSNCHPAPHRFQAIRAPAASTAEKKRREKQADILRMIEASALVTGSFPVTFSTFALDLYPRQEQQLQEEGEALAGRQDAEGAAGSGAEDDIESD